MTSSIWSILLGLVLSGKNSSKFKENWCSTENDAAQKHAYDEMGEKKNQQKNTSAVLPGNLLEANCTEIFKNRVLRQGTQGY